MLGIRSLFLLTAAAATLGCTAKATPGHVLSDSEWRFLTIDGEAPASEEAALTFEGDQLTANVGCNGMGGPWRTDGGRLLAGPLAQTEMFCDGPVWAQENAASALLVAAPEMSVDGDRLTLRSRGHFAELERVSPQQQSQ